ncbi:diguanylate cyclase [Marinobacterium sp. YM272]|uniref:GGDEF domain-containing protein n=1 Tax=Marinobacterium sp. YM272 TaxID=3421654 RepID=UPI003D7F898A
MLLRVLLFIPLLIFSVCVAADPIQLDRGWEFRWGDSPVGSDGVPEWTRGDSAAAWTPIAFPSNPPDRHGAENIWYRTTLPEGQWRDPVLYISSVDLIVDVYVDGRRIYGFGHFDENGKGRFEGWPWHMITLPPESTGKPIYFRIFSDYIDIGLWGEVKVMERGELLGKILRDSTEGAVVGVFSLIVALLALAFSCIQGKRRMFVAIALYALGAASMVISASPATQLMLNAPLLWDYIGALGYFVMPVAMALLMETWFGSGTGHLYRWISRFFVAYILVAMAASLGGLVGLALTYPVFDLLFAAALVLLFVPAVRGLSMLSREQLAILCTYVLFAVLLLIDMGVAHGFLPWGKVPLAWGSLAFSCAVVVIALVHFSRSQAELRALNMSLDQQVKARTAELERLSYEDPLTGLKNRRFFNELIARESARARRQGYPLSMLICDIDHFKQFNDTHGHEAGDEVLRQLALRMKQTFRQTDLACRYGGEEFVVTMPGAGQEDALMRAEELRRDIAATALRYAGKSLPRITISVGVASWPGSVASVDELFNRADKALYRAKSKGRDRVEGADFEINRALKSASD